MKFSTTTAVWLVTLAGSALAAEEKQLRASRAAGTTTDEEEQHDEEYHRRLGYYGPWPYQYYYWPPYYPPATQPTPPSPPTPYCPAPKYYDGCGTACPATCDDPNPETCTFQCVQGCFCPDGLVLNEETNACVYPSQCPSPTPSCAAGQEYDPFAGACVAVSCQAPNACPADLTCVPTSLQCFRQPCPQFTCEAAPTPPTTTCAAPKYYTECGTACPRTCENPNPDGCTYQCVAGCFCPSGLVLDEDSGNCVYAWQCPTTGGGGGGGGGTGVPPWWWYPPYYYPSHYYNNNNNYYNYYGNRGWHRKE